MLLEFCSAQSDVQYTRPEASCYGHTACCVRKFLSDFTGVIAFTYEGLSGLC